MTCIHSESYMEKIRQMRRDRGLDTEEEEEEVEDVVSFCLLHIQYIIGWNFYLQKYIPTSAFSREIHYQAKAQSSFKKGWHYSRKSSF